MQNRTGLMLTHAKSTHYISCPEISPWVYQYRNIMGARAWGFESGARWQPNDKFKVA